MFKLFVAVSIALGGAAVLPRSAVAAEASVAGQPEKLSDAQLDNVTGGMGPPAFVLAAGHGPPWMRNQGPQGITNIGTQVNFAIQDVNLTFNVGSNSDVNLAAALQLSVLSQQPQAASATAVQSSVH